MINEAVEVSCSNSSRGKNILPGTCVGGYSRYHMESVEVRAIWLRRHSFFSIKEMGFWPSLDRVFRTTPFFLAKHLFSLKDNNQSFPNNYSLKINCL